MSNTETLRTATTQLLVSVKHFSGAEIQQLVVPTGLLKHGGPSEVGEKRSDALVLRLGRAASRARRQEGDGSSGASCSELLRGDSSRDTSHFSPAGPSSELARSPLLGLGEVGGGLGCTDTEGNV